MHAVARGPYLGLLLLLLAPFSSVWAVTAVVGEPAPQFSLPALQSESSTVELADYRGKVVYLDFWSAWCAPCRRAMPQLDALRQALPRADFEVVGVNVDADMADGRAVRDKLGVSYPMAADPQGFAAAQFGVEAVPALFVIDRAGVVRHVARGKAVEDVDALRTRLLRLIEEQDIR
jgi:cytochrome c biogenesis protein CcmG, thiol:disulfide interchange protein DsbE